MYRDFLEILNNFLTINLVTDMIKSFSGPCVTQYW